MSACSILELISIDSNDPFLASHVVRVEIKAKTFIVAIIWFMKAIWKSLQYKMSHVLDITGTQSSAFFQ